MSEVEVSPEARNRNAAAAMALKIAGATYEEVAATLGYASEVEARESVERHLAVMARDADPKVREQQRALAGARIERLMRGVWKKANDPLDPEHLPAARVALALVDRHIRLFGLDAPTEVVVHNPTVQEIDAWVATVLGRSEHLALEEPDIVIVEAEVVDDDGSAA
jgi:hypothetical protein